MSEGTPPPAPAPAPRGRLGSAVLPVSGVVILALVARWIFGLLPGHGSGAGNETSAPESTLGTNSAQVVPATRSTAEQTTMPSTSTFVSRNPIVPATAPTEPIRVTVQEDQYLVAGEGVTVAQLVDAARGAAARGINPAVKVFTGPESRVRSRKELLDALDNAHLRYSVEDRSDAKP